MGEILLSGFTSCQFRYESSHQTDNQNYVSEIFKQILIFFNQNALVLVNRLTQTIFLNKPDNSYD
jgi:hypothetical protein